jgi:hypothetical protein
MRMGSIMLSSMQALGYGQKCAAGFMTQYLAI